MTINWPSDQTERVIDWIAERYPVDPERHMWGFAEVVELIRATHIIGPSLDIMQARIMQDVFIETFFNKRAYYWLKPEVAIYVKIKNENDPVWREHLELTLDIRENLYSTPFMVKCDDEDFLVGALQTALAEVGESNWFDWYIELCLEGDDDGDYWEIKRFEEET